MSYHLLEGKTLTKRELKRLQSLYTHLQSDCPDLPLGTSDNPEDFLAKLLMRGSGEGKGELFYPDESVDWDKAYNKGEQLLWQF